MMSDSQTNRPMTEEERQALLKKLLEERYGDPTRDWYKIRTISK